MFQWFSESFRHPGWKSRLLIGLTDPSIQPKNHEDRIRKKYLLYAIGTFRNGQLHGIVQMYGKMTVDPEGHCSHSILNGLSFLGWFEDGKLTGRVVVF